MLRLNLVGNRHPKVGRQAYHAIGEQMHVLCHVRLSGLDREVIGNEEPGTQSGLQGVLVAAVYFESCISGADVESDDIGQVDVVLGIELELMRNDIL